MPNTIYCFCNKEHYSIPLRSQLIMDKNNIKVHLEQNMLDIVEKLYQQQLVTPPTVNIRHNMVLLYLNDKEK